MYSKNSIIHAVIIFLCIGFLIPQSCAHAQSRLINFQGRLTDSAGNVLDGTYNIIFSIYASADDTTFVWSEMHEDVSLSKGLVNVLLGSVVPFSTNLMFDQKQYKPYYLGITIDTDGNKFTKEPEMLPRQQIIPAGYAWNADKLDGKDSSEYTIPATDAGRYPNVVDKLYEGEMALEEKYVKIADEKKFQKRVSQGCQAGYYIQSINENGTVNCKKDVDTDTHLSKTTVQSWANEVDDINRCTTRFDHADCSGVPTEGCPSGYSRKSRWHVHCSSCGYSCYQGPEGFRKGSGWVSLCCTH